MSLWEQWVYLDDEQAFALLHERLEKRFVSYAVKMLRGSFALGQAREHALDFYYWAYSSPKFRRRLKTYNPEREASLATYLGYILRSCWSIYFKKHLAELVLHKHFQSDGMAVDGESMPSILDRTPDDAPLQDDRVIDRDLLVHLLSKVKELRVADAFLIQALYLEAFPGGFSDRCRAYLEEKLSIDVNILTAELMAFHENDDMNGLRQALADRLSVSMPALYVRAFRATNRLRDLVLPEAPNDDED